MQNDAPHLNPPSTPGKSWRYHTVGIVADCLILMDPDGHVLDAHELRSLREAKRQLRRWQDKYTFFYANALQAVSEFFTTQHTRR